MDALEFSYKCPSFSVQTASPPLLALNGVACGAARWRRRHAPNAATRRGCVERAFCVPVLSRPLAHAIAIQMRLPTPAVGETVLMDDVALIRVGIELILDRTFTAKEIRKQCEK